MRQELEQKITVVLRELFGTAGGDMAVELGRPDEQFGDFSTNAALKLAKSLGRPPREVAEELAEELRSRLGDQSGQTGPVREVAVAGPGFINLTLSDQALLGMLSAEPARRLTGKTVVAEYSDPNPFKVLHAGHLYTTVVGNAIGNLLAAAGGQVHRVNFGGDVGLHVGKTMWGIVRHAGGSGLDEAKARAYTDELADKPLKERAAEMAARYVEGNDAYEDDAAAKEKIVAYNKRVYELHEKNEHGSDFAKVYWTCRQWSYDYFKLFYEQIGVEPFEKFYPESETTPGGVATVKEQLKKGVYQESDGAVVFKGEAYGLHTRVFINSQGLPTYEGKDVGLIMQKWTDYEFDLSVVITGNDIVEYMKVVLKSVEQFQPELVERTRHLTHGQVKLEGGVKMSSRKGNVLYADDILGAAETAARKVAAQNTAETAYSAVKYALLKQRLGGDIIYDAEESVAVEGNSGPYLQYAHARARSVLKKAGAASGSSDAASHSDSVLQPDERSLVRKIGEYAETIDQAVYDLMPHHICTYLYELAQTFNRFYEANRVIGDERQQLRLGLVNSYADTLKRGLSLLGIASPDKM